jgi:hypothetical protein
MAREYGLERGLPSVEVRREILEHAGTVLDAARDLVAQLDRYENSLPKGTREDQQALTESERDPWALPDEVRFTPGETIHRNEPDHSLAA